MRTGDGGRAQLRFDDGGMISLQPRTEFRIDRYQYNSPAGGEDKGFFSPAMNSFSHYAFGAVAEWMFRDLAGIETDGAGYQRLAIRPGVASGQAISASYDGPYGRISVAWKQEAGVFSLDVTIPPNSTAKVYLPDGEITEGGRKVRAEPAEDGKATVEVGSGAYHFRSASR